MDVNMPIMDGYAASSEIKKFLKKDAIENNLDPSKKKTQIFAVTAQKEVIENEQKLFDGIILKPISIDGLRNVLCPH
jgi:CheY-like chemotaxis protein